MPEAARPRSCCRSADIHAGRIRRPLAILRIPEAHTLPSDTRWEGDLPGTTLATPADIMERAERLQWMQRAGGRGGSRLNRTSPPRGFVSDYLIQMRGRYQAPPLRAIARVPRIDDSGKIHSISGYDSLRPNSSTISHPPSTFRRRSRVMKLVYQCKPCCLHSRRISSMTPPRARRSFWPLF